jgi:D-3-phosphoglycerate dehydrogenase
MQKVLIAPALLAGSEGIYSRVLKDAGFELVYPGLGAQMVESEILKALTGCVASLAGSEPYSRKVIEAHPQLRVIARVGVGYDAVDLATCAERGIAVTITPNTNHDAVAEHTFTLMLALAKSLVPQHLGSVAGRWPRQTTLPLRGQTLGLAGMGRIGKAVALRGLAFGMKVIAFDPFPDTAFAKSQSIEMVSWEALLKQSDYLSLHLPSTKETRHIINRASLAQMKPTAFLINTARGPLVQEADLAEALAAKRLAGAGLDVFEQEPPAKDHPLFKAENVVITPHAAGVDVKSRDDMAASAAEAIVSLSRGEWPAEKIVNPEIRVKFKW